MQAEKMETDVFILGTGIAGMQAALDVADAGKNVVMVDKSPSIGGKMISLSKVFPTLDCASCITTPRMASVSHHKKITTFTYSEVRFIRKEAGRFRINFVKKPRYVIEEKCISCGKCEDICPVLIKDEFEQNLGAKKAISIPFTNAIPQYPVLDMEHCIACGACARVCPAECIDFSQKEREYELTASAVILSTGFEITPMNAKEEYGGGKFKNVISPLQMERLLAPHGPFSGVVRPSDGKIPDSIAFVQCAGSRDKSIGVPYCSRICCMYSIKQAQLLSGALPLADMTIYYMDIRAFGKGYEQFYQNAKAMGINFVKAKVGKIEELESGNLRLHIERQEGESLPEEVEHDMVVLSQGIRPTPEENFRNINGISRNEYGFIHLPSVPTFPNATGIDGIFAAGAAVGPKDIVDAVQDAGSAAIDALNYIKRTSR